MKSRANAATAEPAGSATSVAEPTFDLNGACAVLRAWLVAAEGESLDCSTAQVSLRAASDMLCGWADSPVGCMAGEPGTWAMFGVNLVALAESAMWSGMSTSDEARVGHDDALVVQRALEYLRRADVAMKEHATTTDRRA